MALLEWRYWFEATFTLHCGCKSAERRSESGTLKHSRTFTSSTVHQTDHTTENNVPSCDHRAIPLRKASGNY